MALYRSKRDIAYFKRIAREFIERVVDEKITYYPISKQYSETNFYGESKTKIVDPPVIVKCLVEWLDQDTSTDKYGQDIVYKIRAYILKDHLDIIGLEPREGDMVDFNEIKFEITKATVGRLVLGKEGEDMGTTLDCISVRDNTFKIEVSGAIAQPQPTAPDNTNRPDQFFDNVTFPRSGSFYT